MQKLFPIIIHACMCELQTGNSNISDHLAELLGD